MGYKHSPANAKLSAFMQKVNNTSKSPSLQLNQQMLKELVVNAEAKSKAEKNFKYDPSTRVEVESDKPGYKKFKISGEGKGEAKKSNEPKASNEDWTKFLNSPKGKEYLAKKKLKKDKFEYEAIPKKEEPKKEPKKDNVPHKTIGVENVDKKAFKGDKQQKYEPYQKFTGRYEGRGPGAKPIYETAYKLVTGDKYNQDYQGAKTVKTEDASEGANVYSTGGRDILSGGEAKDYLGTSTATSEKGDERKSPARYSKTPMLKNEEKFTSVQKKARLSNREQKKEIKEAQKSGKETTDMYAKKRATYVKGPRGGF